MNPAIVIAAYSRPQSLARLLASIQAACFPSESEIPLIISLDDAAHHTEVEAIARQFPWSHGQKEIIRRDDRLGLVAHFYTCGDLSRQYGSMIYLEDDLVVSPVFYPYAAQALSFYQDDPRIAGISLYSLWFNGYTQDPFIPYLDEADIFFIQLPYTQGQAFTSIQWDRFRSWSIDHPNPDSIPYPIHESWSYFNPEEWFPEWTRYVIGADRFFVFPRASLTTGVGDAGTHFSQATGFFQVPLQQEKMSYKLKNLDDSLAVYDSFFEILPTRLNRLTNLFHNYPYTVDLYAARSTKNITSEYVLTTRQCHRPLFSFGKSMRPLEANITQRIPGNGIFFCRKEDLQWGKLADIVTRESNRLYFARGRLPGLRNWAAAKMTRMFNKQI